MDMVIDLIQNNVGFAIIGAVTLIQISPLKIDPWSKLGKWLKYVIYGDVEKKLDAIGKKVESVENRMDEEKVIQARSHILRFADELYDGIHHSQEYFLQILDEIKAYEDYCESHREFANGRTLNACQKIKETYDGLWSNHKF